MILYVLCGLPGSGKTTLAYSLAEQYWAALHAFDDLPGAFSPTMCETVRADMWADIAADLRAGKSVVCDDVHTLAKWRKGLISAVTDVDCEKVLVVMTTPLEECLCRNAHRERRLPDFILTECAKRYEPPTLDEGWDKIIYHQ
jgi:tRNA uridine 5-carbamoylmethylation protein Kti12